MKIAVVAARGLGDGLLAMILSHHLVKSGFDVTTFSSAIVDLNPWFPLQKILPFPQNLKTTFSQFDKIISADFSILCDGFEADDLLILKHSGFNLRKTHVENLVQSCKNILKLPSYGSENGITPLAGLKKHRFANRVVFHGSSGHPSRNWPIKKFLKLSAQLKKEGFETAVAVAPHERTLWQGCDIPLPNFTTLSETASYIYESGFLIGNDSGLGHLASNLDIPVLSLFARQSYADFWRPGWGKNIVVTPVPFLIGAHLKKRYWKHTLPVSKVLKKFKELAKN